MINHQQISSFVFSHIISSITLLSSKHFLISKVLLSPQSDFIQLVGFTLDLITLYSSTSPQITQFKYQYPSKNFNIEYPQNSSIFDYECAFINDHNKQFILFIKHDLKHSLYQIIEKDNRIALNLLKESSFSNFCGLGKIISVSNSVLIRNQVFLIAADSACKKYLLYIQLKQRNCQIADIQSTSLPMTKPSWNIFSSFFKNSQNHPEQIINSAEIIHNLYISLSDFGSVASLHITSCQKHQISLLGVNLIGANNKISLQSESIIYQTQNDKIILQAFSISPKAQLVVQRVSDIIELVHVSANIKTYTLQKSTKTPSCQFIDFKDRQYLLISIETVFFVDLNQHTFVITQLSQNQVYGCGILNLGLCQLTIATNQGLVSLENFSEETNQLNNMQSQKLNKILSEIINSSINEQLGLFKQEVQPFFSVNQINEAIQLNLNQILNEKNRESVMVIEHEIYDQIQNFKPIAINLNKKKQKINSFLQFSKLIYQDLNEKTKIQLIDAYLKLNIGQLLFQELFINLKINQLEDHSRYQIEQKWRDIFTQGIQNIVIILEDLISTSEKPELQNLVLNCYEEFLFSLQRSQFLNIAPTFRMHLQCGSLLEEEEFDKQSLLNCILKDLELSIGLLKDEEIYEYVNFLIEHQEEERMCNILYSFSKKEILIQIYFEYRAGGWIIQRMILNSDKDVISMIVMKVKYQMQQNPEFNLCLFLRDIITQETYRILELELRKELGSVIFIFEMFIGEIEKNSNMPSRLIEY